MKVMMKRYSRHRLVVTKETVGGGTTMDVVGN